MMNQPMMEIPVYLFTGFLGAGKTTFIQDILTDPQFNEGERTLLLLCEEGEEEYDPSEYPYPNVYVETVEDEEDLTPAILRHELPAEKYFILSPSVERLEEIRQRTQALGGLFVVYSLKHALEIVREDVNKGTAMQALREYTGIPREKIMVIGERFKQIMLRAKLKKSIQNTVILFFIQQRR